MIRIVGRVVAAGLVCSWLALPAAADGLARFKEAMKGTPDGALTYKSAKALGDNGFVLEGVVVTPPADATPAGKTEPIEIKRIAVEDFDFAAVDKNAPPNFIKMRVEGIVIGPKPAAGVDLKELAGLDKITADFQLDYRLDPEKKTMTLSKLELDLNGLARLETLDGARRGQRRVGRQARNGDERCDAAHRHVCSSRTARCSARCSRPPPRCRASRPTTLVKIGRGDARRHADRARDGDPGRARRARLLSRRLQTAQGAVARDPQPAGKISATSSPG